MIPLREEMDSLVIVPFANSGESTSLVSKAIQSDSFIRHDGIFNDGRVRAVDWVTIFPVRFITVMNSYFYIVLQVQQTDPRMY